MNDVNKWVLNRAGVLNFWYYDEEEFPFADGHLLLRGGNGSGKTVTMTSLFPFLLDGRKTPERMDSFNSRDRHMIDYLLGEKGFHDDLEEKTGYLYLEFKREQTEQFLTVGMGLNARKSRGGELESWGFSITDNRRINHDFFLYREEKGVNRTVNKIPLTRQQLINAIGEGGQIQKGQKEYAEMVNKLLFGYEDEAAYRELIELLVQIRAPKLSNSYKPSTIYGILNQSLPALTDDELRPLAEIMETMDEHREQIQHIQAEIKNFRLLTREYQRYEDTLLKVKLENYLDSAKQRDASQQHLEELQREVEELTADLADHRQLVEQKKVEAAILTKELEQLKSSEVFSYQDRKTKLETDLRESEDKLNKKEEAIANKQNSMWHYRRQIDQSETAIYRLQKEAADELETLEDSQTLIHFPEHSIYCETLQTRIKETKSAEFWEAWKKSIRAYQKLITKIVNSWQLYRQLEKEKNDLLAYYDGVLKESDHQNRELKQYQETFEQEKEAFQNEVYQWLAQNDWLTFPQTAIQDFERKMNRVYDTEQEQNLLTDLFVAADGYHSEVHQEILNKDHAASLVAEKSAEANNKKIYWEKMTDPEPPRQASTLREREAMMEEGEMVVPLYQAIDFKADVDEDLRKKMEAALQEAGLLDAVILANNQKGALRYNRVLQSAPQSGVPTLADYTDAVSEDLFEAARVREVLESIVIKESITESEKAAGAIELTTSGQSRMSTLLSDTPQEIYGSPRFIGKRQREKHRQEQIALLEAELQELGAEQKDLQEQIQDLQRKQLKNKAWKEEAPRTENMREAFNDLVTQEIRMTAQKSLLKKAEEQLSTGTEKLKEQETVLKLETRDMLIPFRDEDYQQAQAEVAEYSQILLNLQNSHENMAREHETIENYRYMSEEIQADLEQYIEDEILLKHEHQGYQYEYNRILDMLQQLGETEIQAKIEKVQKDLEDTRKLLEEVNTKAIRLEERGPRIKAEERAKEEELTFYTNLTQNWSDLLSEERHFQAKPGSLEDKQWQKETLAAGVHATQQEAQKQLSSVYTRVYDQLLEYHIAQPNVSLLQVSQRLSSQALQKPEWKIMVDHLRDEMNRLEMVAEYQGSKKSIHQVYEQLQKDLDYRQVILKEEEDRLYRDILINNLGKMIQGKVLRAERWIKETENFMRNRSNTSGLLFSIRWKPATGENENQIGTAELVNILRKDPDLLLDSEIEKVRSHFQSKIDYARIEALENENGKTFFQELKQILDYRNWFRFELFYKKGGQDFRPLTDRAFNKMSGGEKAMTMYIPLFSAAHSRYRHAKKDAPSIVVLDEAFAGVDEVNIQDMFGLLEELDFNYVLTSQALWGDYPNVPHLSMCELIRPNNAEYVTVIHYSWNGKERKLHLDDLPEAETEEEKTAAWDNDPGEEGLTEASLTPDPTIQLKEEVLVDETAGEQVSLFHFRE